MNGNLQIASLTSVAIDPFTPSAPVMRVSLNSFAGQTVNIPIDPRYGDLYVGNDDGVYVGGVGRDVLLGGAGQDQHSSATGKLYLATNVGVFVSGAGNDVLIAGTTAYDSDSRGGPYTSVTGRITAIDDDNLESILDDLARDVASHLESRSTGELASFLAFPGFIGGVSVAAGDVNGDVNGDGVDDTVTGVGTGAGPHVKLGGDTGMATITLTRTSGN